MNFEDYQKFSKTTARYPKVGKNFVYPTLGLASEAGEVANKIKKVLRDKNGVIDEATLEDLAKELGDVLWYISQISAELNLSLEDVAKLNIEKLSSRKERGKISGSGDNR